MFPRADIVGARPVASVEATSPITPTGDAHQELAQRLNRIALGSFVQGEVLSHLQDDSFVVKVADTAVRMNLPPGAQVGQTLDLTLVATQPTPTFALATPPPDNSASLSSAGRLVDWILHTAQAAGAPSTLTGNAPLTPSADAEPGQLAASMQDSLEFSGLFYESHVEQWVNGERPLMSLLQEPQSKNSNFQLVATALRAAASAGNPASANGATQTGTGAQQIDTAHLARLIANLSGQPDTVRSMIMALRAALHPESNPAAPQSNAPLPQPNSLSSDANAAIQPALNPPQNEAVATNDLATYTQPAKAADATAEVTALPASESEAAATATAIVLPSKGSETAALNKTTSNESVSMINLQLNTLEHQRVTWKGELWPGQPIEWEIGEDTPQGKQPDMQERSWQSVVRFDMPTLGKVSATVRLTGERVQIQVSAANETTASLLRANGNALSSALATAGSTLELLSVKRDDAA